MLFRSPGRTGAVRRPQQGGQKLADLVAVLAGAVYKRQSLKRSAQVPISAHVAGVQPSAISSSLSNTLNTSLGGCPPGSYPSARWRKYSESDKPHFRANIVTFFFSVTLTRMLIPTLRFLMRSQPHRGSGPVSYTHLLQKPIRYYVGGPIFKRHIKAYRRERI